MLIQSHSDFIHILPALPDNWSSGSFTGLRVRGGAEVDAVWEKINYNITITAQTDNTFKVMVPEYVISILQHKKSYK